MCHLDVTISIDPDVIAIADAFPLPAALTILMADGAASTDNPAAALAVAQEYLDAQVLNVSDMCMQMQQVDLSPAIVDIIRHFIETDRHHLAQFYAAVLHHNATGMWGGLNAARLRYLDQN